MERKSEHKCNHIYHFTLKGLFLKNGVFGKKHCEKCGKLIVLDVKSKGKIIAYAILMALIMIVTIKFEPDFLVGNTHDEKVMIAVPMFITAYIIGLFLILRHVSFVSYRPHIRENLENQRFRNRENIQNVSKPSEHEK